MLNKKTLPAVLGGFLLAVAAGRAAVLLHNARKFPRLRRGRVAHKRNFSVALLTPARNEAHNVGPLLNGLLMQNASEVILLDDNSDDGTGDIARAMCADVAGARVIGGTPLPEGWAGKNWACHQLAAATDAEIVIFVDADVRWKDGALDAILAEMHRSGADLLSCWPRHEVQNLSERILSPIIDMYLLTLVPYGGMRLPWRSTATAVGQVMAFRRTAYDAVGGHGLVKGDVLEDVLMAKRMKEKGYRVRGVLGNECIGVRMYTNYPESVNGYAKSWLSVHGRSRPAMYGAWALQFALYMLPFLWNFPGAPALRVWSLTERGFVAWIAHRRQPLDLAEGLLGPLQPLALLPVLRKAGRKKVTWKGRQYVQ